MKALKISIYTISTFGVLLTLFMVFVILYCASIFGQPTPDNAWKMDPTRCGLAWLTYWFCGAYIVMHLVIALQVLLLIPKCFVHYPIKFLGITLIINWGFILLLNHTTLSSFVSWAFD